MHPVWFSISRRLSERSVEKHTRLWFHSMIQTSFKDHRLMNPLKQKRPDTIFFGGKQDYNTIPHGCFYKRCDLGTILGKLYGLCYTTGLPRLSQWSLLALESINLWNTGMMMELFRDHLLLLMDFLLGKFVTLLLAPGKWRAIRAILYCWHHVHNFIASRHWSDEQASP